MSAGLVERIKGVKDRILFYLEAIKQDQEALRQSQVASDEKIRVIGGELNGKIDILNAQMHDLASEAKRLEQQHQDELMFHILRSDNRYSYPLELEEYRRANPEISLLQYLRSFVASPNVIDIGANVGAVTELLLSAGFRVFAFEPLPAAYDKLLSRFEAAVGFRASPFAIGFADGTTSFYAVEVSDPKLSSSLEADLSVYSTLVKHSVPEGLVYSDPISVKVRSLKSLHDAGELPGDVSIVKIDTEGGDLDVIRGMGNTKYSVIMSEFWDAEHYFSNGEHGLLQNTVAHLRARGYGWHIVIYRELINGISSEPRFYCNIDQSVCSSWGNALFFRDYEVFKEALKWCSSMLQANKSYGS
jgi:FkbM family methyltransferase